VLLDRASEWDELHRWERSELGKALRRLGLTYGEIRELIPVPKGTLSYWCRVIRLSEEQLEAIKARTGPGVRMGVPVDTQWRRREEIERIREEARHFAQVHIDDAFFVGGVVLYWAEGSKTPNDFSISNSDPAALRTFVAWVRRYLTRDAAFVLSMHLHEGNDEASAQAYWRHGTGLGDVRFTKTFIKARGTGHRKNQLEHGVCRVRMRRAGNAWHAVAAWIEVVRQDLGSAESAF
jgi:hypothetical protein